MTFILIDLADDEANLQLANRTWRPFAEEIKRAGLIRGERADMLSYHLCTPISIAEAKAIAAYFDVAVRSGRLAPGLNSNDAAKIAAFAGASSGFEVC